MKWSNITYFKWKSGNNLVSLSCTIIMSNFHWGNLYSCIDLFFFNYLHAEIEKFDLLPTSINLSWVESWIDNHQPLGIGIRDRMTNPRIKNDFLVFLTASWCCWKIENRSHIRIPSQPIAGFGCEYMKYKWQRMKTMMSRLLTINDVLFWLACIMWSSLYVSWSSSCQRQ